MKMAFNYKVIGQEGNKDKHLMHCLTGKLDFSADNLLGKKLFARTLGSPHAAAIIVSIDTSQAEALEGVEAVCTHEDCPIWSDTIRYCGQEVAAVAAVDEATAARALELIDVVYDERLFVLDPDEAMEPGAPIVGIYPESNVREPASVTTRGDYEAGLAAATNTITAEDVGWTNYFQHGNLEAVIGVAYWVGDHLYVWTTSQNPFGHRNSIARALDMPLHKVHLISHGTGSGHGDKHACEPAIVAAVLAKKAGKPVQNSLSRAENFVMRVHQFPLKATIKIGASDDGTITGIDSTYYADAAVSTSNRGGGGNDSIRYTYKCDDARYTGYTVVTNKPRSGAWRCVAHPQATYITEIAIDMLAEEVGMNPLAFRLKNIQPPSPDGMDVDAASGVGRPLASNGLADCLQQAADAIGWSTNWHAPGTETMADGRMHGIGINGHIDGHGGMSSARGAIVNMTRDGKALINSGISRAGNGSSSAMCHIVAEVLGLNYDDVMIGDWGNTDVCSDGGSQGGSTRIITLGAAMLKAAEDARDQLFDIAKDIFDPPLPVSALEAKDGTIREIANTSNAIPIDDVVSEPAYTVIGRGYGWAEEIQVQMGPHPPGTRCEVRGVSAVAAEVAVDTETGEVEILAIANAVDNGVAVFWQGSLGQIDGGTEITIGEALLYEQIHDQLTGVCLNPNFLDHKFPTSLDMDTNNHTAIIVEPFDYCGPFGAKGMGEPCVSNYGAICNAIYNAIGEWIVDPPIYPQKILKALGKA